MQARFCGNINKMGVEGTSGRRTSRQGLGSVTTHALLRYQSMRGNGECGSYPDSDKAATAEIHGAKGDLAFRFR